MTSDHSVIDLAIVYAVVAFVLIMLWRIATTLSDILGSLRVANDLSKQAQEKVTE